jgi:hypothetical protein
MGLIIAPFLVLVAISRSRAAEQKAVKRLGGATRHSEESAFCEQHRIVPRNAGASERLSFLLVRFL